ncbi:TIGR03905 family TSCPD domain-containing protein [Clostridium botulinum]|uniref:TIGR03905 family TSCPD domain-containing protein n=1 Tax=unclassified Clostridium TaxID=2614128 RepID=UPI0013C9FA37|nr:MULTISPECIES: TIGR03905 family TSCPD domain-containing protein [unclassified Clostridium]NFG41898.1 TIGR03905 family TSCPD domain-containing protein [Clostridium botulinum]MBZ9692167.1 TIGR03905 family TSCPD domain-containing protein [Clostridium sp. M14]NFI03595.1 TIGR03905 family TSCPD domain-containing protein [Clostridium botulinum]NFI56821.1 TIGR03905 family TSCPD domain-containing protein [Clostridium botulinum]NFI95351.1 TIGR03905 family TSCPD domain-containing protein [Clostridium b
MFSYKTQGVCSSTINIEIENNKIQTVNFIGGCSGNLLGISALVKNMDVDMAIEKLKGIKCGLKETSCPDQLAKALTEWKISC